MVPLRKKLVYYVVPICTPVRLPVAHPYILHRMHVRGCVRFHLSAIIRVRSKLRRISHLRHRQLRCQACASVFIPQWLASVRPLRMLLACVFPSCCCYQLLVSVPAAVEDYVKQRILFYHRLGKSFVQITHCLAEEGHTMTEIGICKFIRRCEETGMSFSYMHRIYSSPACSCVAFQANRRLML